MTEPIKVLYVDDKPLDREIVVDVLEKDSGGFRVIEATSRTEFEARLADSDYDLVLTDLSLFGFEGTQVLDAVHSKNPHVPVIIVTDAGSEEVAVEAMKHGAADYGLKSNGHINRLPQTIHAALEKKRLVEESRQSEDALRDSESKYRDLVENLNDVIYALDEVGIITYVSPVIQTIAGYSPAEVIGRHLVELLDPEDAPLLTETFRSVLAGDLRTSEFRIRVKSGQVIWVRSSSRPIKVGNRPVGLRGVLTDITEKKQAERRIEHQLQRITSLHAIDMAISSSLDLRVTLKVLIEQVTEQLLVDAAAVSLLNPHTLTLEYAERRGFGTSALQHTNLRMGEGHAGKAAFERRIVAVSDLRGDLGSLGMTPELASEGFVFYCAAPLIAKGRVKGVLEIFHRTPFSPDEEWMDFLTALAIQAAIAIDNAGLFDDLQRSNVELGQAYEPTIEGWSRALDLRERESEGHTQHVVETTLQLARLMGVEEAQLVHLRRGALLHDIGKMGVPDAILFKQGALTDDEWKVMRMHPVNGYRMLSAIPFLRPALDIPYCHHEKWDGTGYPRGLRGEEIPLGARIFAVVDVWDALRSVRPYRPPWPLDKVYEYIRSQTGNYFDPHVVELFLSMER